MQATAKAGMTAHSPRRHSKRRLRVGLMIYLRLSLAVSLVSLGVLLPSRAFAVWKNTKAVTYGTARVLDRGEINFGVFAPIAWGVRDWLTVQTHPVFDLLLEENLAARACFVDNNWGAVSATLSYKQGFLSVENAYIPGEHVGNLQAGVIGTLFVGDRVILSGTALWAPKIHRGLHAGDYGMAQGMSAVATVHVLGGRRDLFMATTQLRYSFISQDLDWPVGTFAWIHDVQSYESMHIVLGLSVGQFGIRNLTGSGSGQHTTVYAWPVVDLWWQL